MTGTPSQTATALDGGLTRYSVVVPSTSTPRGFVGRKLEAKLWSEVHEPHLRHRRGGRDCVASQSPMSSGAGRCICGGYVERRSRALPRDICLSASEFGREKRLRASRRSCPGRWREHAPKPERIACHANIRTRAREAERLTKGRQKSAESKSCQRTAT